MAKKKSPPTSAAAKAPSRCNWLLFTMDSCDVYRIRSVDYPPDDAGAFVSACGAGARATAVARATSRSKLKSEDARPVISLEPRLKVRSWMAHFRKTTTRLWYWTRYMMWISDQMSHAGSPARWTPNTFATAE